ncbi:hypothetical protein Dsin_027109 [Dipteronia sinensis]|uniref:Uncharacterized protein n=1 Tax=Dipteronia sinensis TaxID=43782 RepID=A0AAE0DZV9_9ROSI|nr:hypothetical protein Dsin_027109 [Dipteronia sinensis]
MVGSIGIGYWLNFGFKSRRTKGLFRIVVVALLGSGIWASGFANQLNYSHNKLPEMLDFKDSGSCFASPFVWSSSMDCWMLYFKAWY